MKYKKSLKEIPIEQNSNEPIRKFDAMSKNQKYICLFLFLMVNALFYLSQKYGPPFYHIETISFDKSEMISNTRKFLLKIGEFNFLNDFITLDLVLIKNHDIQQKNFVDVSLTIKSIKGKRSEILYYQNSKEYQITFSEDAKISNKMRLYSRGIIDFIRLESDLVMKFHSESSEEESDPYSGAFIFTYVDASHAIIEALIRLIFFICGIVWLVYLNNIDISKTSTPLQLNLIRFSVALVIFASNPLYILSYFTESHFLPFLDSIFAIILIFSVLASTLIMLDSTHTKQIEITRKFYFMECAPFVAISFLFFYDEYVTHYSDDNNIIQLKFLNFFKIGGISVCFILVVVSSLLFNAKNWFDRINMMLMIYVTIELAIYLECVESIEPVISSNHAVQIFTLATVSSYVFFLAFIYMPVDPMSADDDYNNDYNNYIENDDENSYDVAD